MAINTGGVNALHDPTEGGLAMGLHELASATGCGVRAIQKEISIIPEAKLFCDQYDLNILGVIASGALLIVTETRATANIIENLRAHNINVKTIGKLKEPGYGVKLVVDNQEIDLPEFHQDEITKLFS